MTMPGDSGELIFFRGIFPQPAFGVSNFHVCRPNGEHISSVSALTILDNEAFKRRRYPDGERRWPRDYQELIRCTEVAQLKVSACEPI
jgi:hypothetical protein